MNPEDEDPQRQSSENLNDFHMNNETISTIEDRRNILKSDEEDDI